MISVEGFDDEKADEPRLPPPRLRNCYEIILRFQKNIYLRKSQSLYFPNFVRSRSGDEPRLSKEVDRRRLCPWAYVDALQTRAG